VPGARGRGRTRPKELHAAQGSHSNHGKAPAGNGQRAKQNHAQAGNDVRPKPSDLHAAKGVAGVAAPA
jgi:hypothetical protein